MILGDFREAVRAHARLAAGERVLAAVSGGGDSVAMLHLLVRVAAEIPFTIVVAHVNHKTRGEDADADERFVCELASRLDLRCSVLVPGPEAARKLASGSEEAMRAERHLLLRRAAGESGCSRIALAHTMDDQAETFLMRLVRGAGRRGLSAMVPSGPGPLIRPMLGITRGQARAWLERIGEPWREDETNRSGRFLRNRVRARLVPLLEELNPAIVRRLAKTARLLGDEDRYLDALAAEWIGAHGRRGPGDTVALRARDGESAAGLAGLPRALARRVARLALEAAGGEPRGASQAVVEAILRLAARGSQGEPLSLSGGMGAVLDGLDLVVGRRQAGPAPHPGVSRSAARFSLELPIPGRVADERIDGEMTAEVLPRREAGEGRGGAGRVCLDAARFGPAATVRNRLPGDIFHPLGGPGRRKLADFLIDRKVPRNKRDRILLVVGDVGIAWVVGERIGHPYRLTGSTERVLVLEHHPRADPPRVDRD